MRGFEVRDRLNVWEMMCREWDVEGDWFASGGEEERRLSIGIVPGIARGLWIRL